jgi:LmbE family N-acetylglucosaminyl deacetylase
MAKSIFIAALVLLVRPCALFCQEIEALPEFSKNDRVLVFVPHPDDEAIAAGGVLMRAHKAGAQIKVVCFTNGDHNEVAFILYEKRLTLRKGEFLHMGGVRRKESLNALSSIGIGPENVVYFGYPDFGTLSIMLKYWGAETKPYFSILTRINKVSYSDALSPGAPYRGESILDDVRRVLIDFKPNKIFVSHPADTNMDHQALYLFLKVVLWELEDTLHPEVYPYLIHVKGWPVPRGLHSDLDLIPPPENTFDVAWKKLDLSSDEIARKSKMIGFYKSQLAYVPSYLYTFVRKNELFGDCPEVNLKKSLGDIYVWHNITQGDEAAVNTGADANQVSHLAFCRKDDNFFVKIVLKTALTKNLGVRFLLLPFSKKTDFAKMPKFSITIGLGGMHINDKQRTVTVKDSLYTAKDRIIVIKLPLSSLGDPDRILCKAWARFSSEFPFKAPAWRVINVGQNE